MDGIPLKRFKSAESVVQELCIICQNSTLDKLTSTENGRNRIIDASLTRKDEVYDRITSTLAKGGIFYYHVTNVCYKWYTDTREYPRKSDEQMNRSSSVIKATRSKLSISHCDRTCFDYD